MLGVKYLPLSDSVVAGEFVLCMISEYSEVSVVCSFGGTPFV